MVDERTQFTMRINTQLWEVVKKEAEQNKRSAVKEVEYILEKYFKDRNEN